MSDAAGARQLAETDVIRRADVAAQIETYLRGGLSDAALAAWAFDRFYGEEVGEFDYELGYEPVLAEVLDALMFHEDKSFRLSEAELRKLVSRLSD